MVHGDCAQEDDCALLLDETEVAPSLQTFMAIAEAKIAIRTGGNSIHQHFVNAVEAYRAALTVRCKESLPQDWATTQNNLGIVLREQGIRANGGASTQLLDQAVTAYREALTVYTKNRSPNLWAGIQSNLGNALQEQGIRTTGQIGMRLLAVLSQPIMPHWRSSRKSLSHTNGQRFKTTSALY